MLLTSITGQPVRALSDYAKAEPLYRQALEIRKQTLGEKHPAYAESLNTLAVLYMARATTPRPAALAKALEIRKQALGENSPWYAESLNDLAWVYKHRGDYAKAEPLMRQALEIRKQTLGEKHPHYV